MTRVQTASLRRKNSRPLLRSGDLCWVAPVLALAGLWSTPRAAVAQPPLAASAQLVRVDGIAAIVGGAEPGELQRTILRSDVELRARLALLGHDVNRALLGELPASLLAASLQELLGEQLIAAEAERVQIAKPRPVEVAREQQNVVREAGGWRALGQLLARFDIQESELEDMARRRALISAFLRANLEGATVVTENQVDERLRADAARAAGAEPGRESNTKPGEPGVVAAASDPAVRAAARAAISNEALMRNIERWVRVLRARTRVRVFATFEAP
jgi:hypothetical protein